MLDFDVIVIGGGHAGAEAASAACRLRARVALVTMDPTKIGAMSCNPAIGGLAKGQIAREIDALGGVMGLATDATGIQFRMLNRSKGPAVWGPRAQADKHRYAAEVQRLISHHAGLTVIQGEVADLTTEQHHDQLRVVGVELKNGRRLTCRAAVVTTGTFLAALMHTGEAKTVGGRVGEAAAASLSGCLARLGLELGRLKTGTPPRLLRDSIDFAAFEPQPGDDDPAPFSYLAEYATPAGRWLPPAQQVLCYIGHTHEAMHALIRANIHRAPMYSGQISSVGPRYCPSIEDKVVRFADKPSHHIFLEPEGLDTDSIYVNGISTSLPADVQDQVVAMIPGLQRAKILRYGYAVEYDMVWPSQIEATGHVKKVAGLFLAGQINGTSGYEEAGAQGLIAGINAARLAAGKSADFVLRRDQAYIGVLMDDLVTKPPTEPYRMFTSRAEHRLLLRADNADDRLTPLGREAGLVDDARWAGYQTTRTEVASAMALLESARVAGVLAIDWLRRPESTWPELCLAVPAATAINPRAAARAEIIAKYQGYIARQDRQVERFAAMESKRIPPGVDYSAVPGLRAEARQKLTKFGPLNLGQALRISGITPADIAVLGVYLGRKG